MDLLNNLTLGDRISLINMILTFILTVIALYFTIKSYKLKSGQCIRGSFSTASSVYCDESYVNTIELENYKDKAIIIYKIYLKIGYSCYIELENFEEKPLILNPFELYKKNYDPIEMYSVNCNKALVKDILTNKKIKKRIVLSTSNGKYTIKRKIKHWDAIYIAFKNHMTAILITERLTYKDKAYGGNVKYLVDIENINGYNEVIPIYENIYNVFKNFKLNSDNIKSKNKLEEFLTKMKEQKKLNCSKFKVIDMESFRKETYKDYFNKQYNIETTNWFMYYVVGKVITIYDEYKLYIENKKIQKRNKNIFSEDRKNN